MYHKIVESKIRQAFAGLNAGRIEAITGELAKNATHYFIGTHALSGKRNSNDAIYRWYQRLLRLLPGIQFELHQIDVRGWPWNTLVTAQWTERNQATDGVPTSAEGLNIITLSWGKVTSIRIYTDTAMLTKTLNRIAEKGVLEAQAAPIVS